MLRFANVLRLHSRPDGEEVALCFHRARPPHWSLDPRSPRPKQRGDVHQQRPMQLRQLLLTAAVGGFTLAAQYPSTVTAYVPGAGVASGYTDPAAALGEPSRSTPGTFGGPVDPFNAPYLGSQVVGIGTGGSLTVHFDTPIQNDPSHPKGIDFQVFSGSFFVVTNSFDANFNYIGTPATDGSVFGAGAAATRVSVSADGITFFTLNPALAPQIKSLFPTDGAGDFTRPVDPSLTSADFAGLTLDGVRSRYAGSAGGTGFDLAWAQDGTGHSIAISQASYVRIDVVSGKIDVDGLAAVRGLTSVPEPSVVWMGTGGVIAILLTRRERRSGAQIPSA